MVKQHILFITFILGMIVLSCSKSNQLDIDAYTSYIESEANGLSVKKQVGEFEFGLLYKPVDYVVAREIQNKILTEEDFLDRKTKLEGYQYYTLRIRSNEENEFIRANLSSEAEYYHRLEYMVTDAQSDIILIEGNDTIPCAIYHFERNYGHSPNNNIVLGFESRDPFHTSDKILVYDDQILGLGRIELRINANSIKNIPQLEI